MEELTVLHIHRLAVKKDKENVTRVCGFFFFLHDHRCDSYTHGLFSSEKKKYGKVFLRFGRKKTSRNR